MKVKFLKTCVVQDGTGTRYLEGEVHELSDDSAQHWIVRGKAEQVDKEETVKKTLVSAAKAKEPEKAESVSVPDKPMPEPMARVFGHGEEPEPFKESEKVPHGKAEHGRAK